MSKVFCREIAITMSIVCLTALLGPRLAQAGIMPNMSGNHRAVSENGYDDETVNFAVYRLDGIRKNDRFGTGYAGFDTAFVRGKNSTGLDRSAQYLYLYQQVNDGRHRDRVKPASISAWSMTSWGSWNLAFRDDDGLAGVGNPFGPDGARFSPAARANTGVKSPGISRSPNLVRPTVNYENRFPFEVLGVNYENPMDKRESGWIFGFTSNLAPEMWRPTLEESPDEWATGAIPLPALRGHPLLPLPDDWFSGLNRLTAQVGALAAPIAVPEPASVALAALGTCGLAVLRRGRANLATLTRPTFGGIAKTFLCRGIFWPEWLSSVRPAVELSFRYAVTVPESYRIDEFRDARRESQLRSPE